MRTSRDMMSCAGHQEECDMGDDNDVGAEARDAAVFRFAGESEKLSEVHEAVVASLKELGAGAAPAAARICLDNLSIANMCLQQLAFVLANQAKLRNGAVDAAMKKFGGKPG